MSKPKNITVRYEVNPFIENMVIPIKGKQVQLSPMGKDENVLVNQATGEVQGTHVTTYKKVDSAQFIKLFTANIALTFGLNAAGIKAFSILAWVLQDRSISKDLVPLDKFVLGEFLKEKEELSMSLPTFSRGLANLEKSQIIAKHIRQGWYYINPNLIFNGNRIAFTTVIERKEEGTENQLDMDLK